VRDSILGARQRLSNQPGFRYRLEIDRDRASRRSLRGPARLRCSIEFEGCTLAK
jgi:hypothetical protein